MNHGFTGAIPSRRCRFCPVRTALRCVSYGFNCCPGPRLNPVGHCQGPKSPTHADNKFLLKVGHFRGPEGRLARPHGPFQKKTTTACNFQAKVASSFTLTINRNEVKLIRLQSLPRPVLARKNNKKRNHGTESRHRSCGCVYALQPYPSNSDVR